MIETALTIVAVWFIGACLSFVVQKLFEMIGAGISDHKTPTKKVVKIAGAWPIYLLKFIAGMIK